MEIQKGRWWLRFGRKRRRCSLPINNSTKFQEECKMKKLIAVGLTAAMTMPAVVSVKTDATVGENL